MFPFIEELDELALEGHKLVAAGKIREAKEIARRLDRSPYSEGWVHAERILARIDLQRGHPQRAKERALRGLSNAWGDGDLLAILRLGNPEVKASSRLFQIRICAGIPSKGPIHGFSEDYEVEFEVVAENDSEALSFVVFVGRIDDSHAPKVVKVTSRLFDFRHIDRHGVYRISPFQRTGTKL